MGQEHSRPVAPSLSKGVGRGVGSAQTVSSLELPSSCRKFTEGQR